MKTSQKGINLILSFEGFSSKPIWIQQESRQSATEIRITQAEKK